MNNKFDEMTRNLAVSVTRRQALRRFGSGLAGVLVAFFGLTNRTDAGRHGPTHACFKACNHCRYPYGCSPDNTGCFIYCNGCCSGG